MEQYFRLASRTRDLEQAYTKQTHMKYSIRVKELENEIAQLKIKIERITNEPKEETEQEKEEITKQMNEELKEMKKKYNEIKEKYDKIENKKNKKTEQANNENRIWEEINTAQKELTRMTHTIRDAVEENKLTGTRLESMVKRLASNRTGNKKEENNKILEIAIEGRLEEAKSKIKELYEENEKYKEIIQRERREKEDTKSTAVILRSTIENKEKIIQKQMAEIEKLKKAAKHPFEAGMAEGVACVPEEKPKSDAKKRKARQETKEIDIKSLIKAENKSFFNNLSFTNSSPMPDRKFGKK